MTEKYINRLDRLLCRNVLYAEDYNKQKKSFGPAEVNPQREILMIKDTFDMDRSPDASDMQIRELVYYLDEEKIHVTYHRHENKVSSCTREFQKPTLGGGASNLASSDTALDTVLR